MTKRSVDQVPGSSRASKAPASQVPVPAPKSRPGREPASRRSALAARGVGQLAADLRSGFRFPTADDPPPPARRMLWISLWATVLALSGLAVGAWALVAMMFETRLPGWFPPAVITTGLIGVVLTGSAFAAVHGRRLPVLMLTGATGALLVTLILTLVAV